MDFKIKFLTVGGKKLKLTIWDTGKNLDYAKKTYYLLLYLYFFMGIHNASKAVLHAVWYLHQNLLDIAMFAAKCFCFYSF